MLIVHVPQTHTDTETTQQSTNKQTQQRRDLEPQANRQKTLTDVAVAQTLRAPLSQVHFIVQL